MLFQLNCMASYTIKFISSPSFIELNILLYNSKCSFRAMHYVNRFSFLCAFLDTTSSITMRDYVLL